MRPIGRRPKMSASGWAGVTSKNDNVETEIAMKESNLHGRISPDIGLLGQVHFALAR
jgi:hypothetical protein